LVLVIGDFHIPHRKDDLPEQFKTLLAPGKVKHVLCTGNVCSKAIDEWLHSICNSVHIVRGDMDSSKSEYPEQKVVKIGSFTIGLVHGHQVIPWGDTESLATMQRKLDCDILISGHTHKNEVIVYDKKYIVNPGSVTGSYSPSQSSVTPSFVLMAVKGSKVVTFVYELQESEVNVSKSEFVKKTP